MNLRTNKITPQVKLINLPFSTNLINIENIKKNKNNKGLKERGKGLEREPPEKALPEDQPLTPPPLACCQQQTGQFSFYMAWR
jgi:hypothetical protein